MCQLVTGGPPVSTALQAQEGQRLAAFLGLWLDAATALTHRPRLSAKTTQQVMLIPGVT